MKGLLHTDGTGATLVRYACDTSGSPAAWRLGMLETEDYLRAVDLRPVAGRHLPAGRDVDQEELAALIEVPR